MDKMCDLVEKYEINIPQDSSQNHFDESENEQKHFSLFI